MGTFFLQKVQFACFVETVRIDWLPEPDALTINLVNMSFDIFSPHTHTGVFGEALGGGVGWGGELMLRMLRRA